jgi:hypothetical protein
MSRDLALPNTVKYYAERENTRTVNGFLGPLTRTYELIY